MRPPRPPVLRRRVPVSPACAGSLRKTAGRSSPSRPSSSTLRRTRARSPASPAATATRAVRINWSNEFAHRGLSTCPVSQLSQRTASCTSPQSQAANASTYAAPLLTRVDAGRVRCTRLDNYVLQQFPIPDEGGDLGQNQPAVACSSRSWHPTMAPPPLPASRGRRTSVQRRGGSSRPAMPTAQRPPHCLRDVKFLPRVSSPPWLH